MRISERSFWPTWVLTSWVLFAVGCGPAGPTFYKVHGTITFDGKPLPSGDIMFLPVTPGIGPDGAVVKDGKYSMKTQAGVKRVEIRAAREVPGKTVPRIPPLTGTEPVMESYIPDIYNTESTLSAIVSDAVPDAEFNFELTSEAK